MKIVRNAGFTLIELLVVVLIIGILAAIALPQYQKAVLKSRYSGLMPIASAVANGQEIYYMDKGHYSTDITQLDIKAPSGGVNAEIEVNDGSDERFDYVLATRTDVPGLAYVMYQKHSQQFPDAIMCEANDTLNSQASWLCKDALKGEEVTSGSLQGTGWTAYLLKGVEGSSSFADPNSITTFANKTECTTNVCNFMFDATAGTGMDSKVVQLPDGTISLCTRTSNNLVGECYLYNFNTGKVNYLRIINGAASTNSFWINSHGAVVGGTMLNSGYSGDMTTAEINDVLSRFSSEGEEISDVTAPNVWLHSIDDNYPGIWFDL